MYDKMKHVAHPFNMEKEIRCIQSSSYDIQNFIKAYLLSF